MDEFIAEIPYDEKIQIMKDYSDMEKTGSTGDTCLRKYAEKMLEQNQMGEYSFILCVEVVASRVWRFFAMALVGDEVTN